MARKVLILIVLVIVVVAFFGFLKTENRLSINSLISNQTDSDGEMGGEMESEPYSLSIDALRQGEYPGSDFVIEQTLDSGSNYKRYVASYKSEGLKIYGLLTVPDGAPPAGGFPAIIFNHGYIAPSEYRTTEKYVAYQDGFARNGYVSFKSDYRGHGSSEGVSRGGYSSNDYTIDVLNALSSVERMENVNKEKIGMWGHSMGGFITLRAMVVRPEIKAGVIWAGVVGSYEDLIDKWRRRGVPSNAPTNVPNTRGGGWRQSLTTQFGSPSENPKFWRSLSANSYLNEISGPVQLHHGDADDSVPLVLSEILEKQMKEAGKPVELYTYPGDDHNISNNFNIAQQRSIEYFDKYVK